MHLLVLYYQRTPGIFLVVGVAPCRARGTWLVQSVPMIVYYALLALMDSFRIHPGGRCALFHHHHHVTMYTACTAAQSRPDNAPSTITTASVPTTSRPRRRQ
jgi:hypothetical protein